MNSSLKLQSPWIKVKERLKEVNNSLTDEDLSFEPGHEDEMIDRLSKKLNRSQEDVRDWIESVSANEGIAS
jgi:hypothetical protein